MQEMPQNGTGVQGDWLLGIQVMPTSPLEGYFAAVLSTAIASVQPIVML